MNIGHTSAGVAVRVACNASLDVGVFHARPPSNAAAVDGAARAVHALACVHA